MPKNARKSFLLYQVLEPVTAGFTVNRVKTVLTSTRERVKSVKSGTYTMRSAVWQKKEKKRVTVIVGLFSREKRRLKTYYCPSSFAKWLSSAPFWLKRKTHCRPKSLFLLTNFSNRLVLDSTFQNTDASERLRKSVETTYSVAVEDSILHPTSATYTRVPKSYRLSIWIITIFKARNGSLYSFYKKVSGAKFTQILITNTKVVLFPNCKRI